MNLFLLFPLTMAIFMCHRDSRTNFFPSALLNFLSHVHNFKDFIKAVKEGVLKAEWSAKALTSKVISDNKV